MTHDEEKASNATRSLAALRWEVPICNALSTHSKYLVAAVAYQVLELEEKDNANLMVQVMKLRQHISKIFADLGEKNATIRY